MKHFAGLVLAFVLLAGSSQGADEFPWPHEGSDLAPDPRITFGRLENGVRLAVFPHDNPKGRISLRLYVAAGSLHENEDERGLAHFVEHMAFNGTMHFPSGKLVEFLQRQGMGFGADVNATTSASTTVYKLELNDSSVGSLREALRIFRDYADGIQFEPAAVERERGIILAETRVRDTAASRRDVSQLKALFPDSRLANRPPIGLSDIVRHATPAALKAFYQAWYRPERMTLIVCGDVTAAEARQEIQQVFEDMKASAPARPEPTLSAVSPDESFPIFLHRDPGEMGVTIGLGNVQNVISHSFTSKDARQRFFQEIAYNILRERTDRLLARKDSPEGGFGMGTQLVEEVYRKSQFVCGTSVSQWKPALRDLVVELRRARTQGFTAEEIARQRLGFETYFKEAVAAGNRQTSSSLADQLVDLLASNRIMLSPEQQLKLAQACIGELTPEACQAVLNDAWDNGRKIIWVATNDTFTATPAEIAEVHDQGTKISLGAPGDHQVASFGYTDFGPPGEVTAKTLRPADDIWDVTFRNGVRLHFKQTKFETNNVRIAIRFGNGRLDEPADKPGLGLLAFGQLYGGLGKHTLDELGMIMTGSHGSLSFNVEDHGFLFSATSTPDNALLFTQLLTAFVVDPALREESRARTYAAIANVYRQNWDGPRGVILELIHPQLMGGDTRLGMPRRNALDTYSLAAYKEWYLPQTKSSPMDVFIVGDITIDTAVELVARTAAALPPRLPPPDLEKKRILHFPKKPFDFTWNVRDTKSQSGFIKLYWPLPKHLSGVDQRRLGLLMDVVGDRLRVSIRQAMGKTYSPSTTIEVYRGFQNYGWLTCLLEADPSEILRVQKAALEQVSKLVKTGVSADELKRAQQVRLADDERRRQTNDYWLMALDESSLHPELAEFHALGAEIVRGTTVADIDRLAREYLRSDRVSVFRIVPEKAQPEPKKK